MNRRLSIVIPAYNESAFIGTLLKRIDAVPTQSQGFEKDIIVVDDGSKDATAQIATGFPNVRVLRQTNQGKGAAVQNGIRAAKGDYVIVQDADLEYDPADYLPMLKKIDANHRTVVYGSRLLGQKRDHPHVWPSGRHPKQRLGAWMANRLLTLWTAVLFGRWISDPLTAYKLYPTSLLKRFHVRTCGFESDHELTAKIIKAGHPIVEVPISYSPRSLEEGKKIRARDGLIAIWTLLRFRFHD